MKVEFDDFFPWLEIENIGEVLNQKISILDVMDLYGVEYMAGIGTHKARCPFHSDGQERTPSFYIYEDSNSFYCFSCHAGSTLIDFVRLYNGTNYYVAIEELSKMAGLKEGEAIIFPPKVPKDPEKTVEYYVSKSGIVIKSFLRAKQNHPNYTQWKNWAEARYKKLDEIWDRVSDDDWERAKRYFERLNNYLGKR